MNPFVWLGIAIVSEVFGSTMLKLSNGFKKLLPSVGVVLGMGISFYMFSIALQALSLGTAYAIWSGVGTALTALMGVILFKESLHLKKIIGLLLIVGGVILIKLSTSAS